MTTKASSVKKTKNTKILPDNQAYIHVHKATENNLKNISLKIPKNQITVITGLSGSGKSSLAFDTIYSEGQRRYIESLSTYAKQFMGGYKKPTVEKIEGLSPSIAIDQKTITPNPRSTVGTLTESYDFLRLLMARLGTPFCPDHKIAVTGQSYEKILDSILKMKPQTKFLVLAPVARSKKGEFQKEIQSWIKNGFIKALIDGEWVELHTIKKLSKTKPHNIDVLVDRLIIDEKYKSRLKESILRSLKLTDGYLDIEIVKSKNEEDQRVTYSTVSACPKCNYSFPNIEPRIFSFNNPNGACTGCDGLGVIEYEVDYEDSDEKEFIWETCESCDGGRLKPTSLNIFLKDKNIFNWASLPLNKLEEELKSITFTKTQKLIADKILEPLFQRIKYMNDVGCGYLQLARPTKTLSGGEAQRVRLATQLGSEMVGITYVLDEPSIGLHPKDHLRLLEVIQKMKERGNTVIMVEHDEETILQANHLIDMGPRAGRLGGEILAEGTLSEILKNKKSLTAPYLNKSKSVFQHIKKRKPNSLFIDIKNASGHNLKNVNAKIPLQLLVGITGASGSGKSTLINQTLVRSVQKNLGLTALEPEPHDSISGIDHVDKIIEINQRPIGRNPRSIPVTYVGLYSHIRNLMANLPESKIRGYKASHFSFNVKAGRCEHCQGAGQIKLEMHFMNNVYVTCEHCNGQRYSPEILKVRFKEKNIFEILSMTVEEAFEFFKNHKLISEKLKTLMLVGLDYMTLGQSSTTLSGGEAQRIKLSKELSKKATGKTLYILDEPTTGLHFEDIDKLLRLLHQLVEQGNSVIVIEHNVDIIRNCDHIIDLGPEGGTLGGQIIATGTPEEIKINKNSLTGQFL